MTTVYVYRIYCETDSKYELVWGTTPPTKCPIETSHTVDLSSVTVVQVIDPNETTIKEETVPTGGNYASETLHVDAIANSTTISTESFGFPISALTIRYVSTSEHYLDEITVSVDKDRIIGALTANVAPATTWVSQNYVIGNAVNYNNKLYSCIQNTVSNEVPTNLSYWRRGLKLSVSSTVIDYTMAGYYITVDNFTNADRVGRVISVDQTNNCIYVDTNLTNSFLATTPTYIRRSICPLKNYIIGAPSEENIGIEKIGGSYVPGDTVVTVEYKNKSTTDNKIFIGALRYLY
jgi:hypothetical protein